MACVRQILFVRPAPIVWAEHLGLFARSGIEVETTQTLSSDQLGQGLADGSWDVGIASLDNVIAWNAQRHAGLQVIAQLERSTVMALCAAPECRDLAAVVAEPIAIDAPTNGFALVLYRALRRADLDARGLRLQPEGGVRHRFDALVEGRVMATILVPPFIDMALARGFRTIWQGSEVAPAYPGVVVAARVDWLCDHRDTARRYLQALVAANEWASAHANQAAQALVAARYSEAAAQRLVQEAVPGLSVSLSGWDEIISLRRECSLLPDLVPRFEEVIDQLLLAEV